MTSMGGIHGQVAAAIARGDLERGPCEQASPECSEKVHAHHDDYAKPLDVRWLCVKHHTIHHRNNGPGLNRPKDQMKGIVFFTSPERAARLDAMAKAERRTKTTLLREALDLLFASREKEKAA